jgi:RHS repeat-associated protein
MLEQTVSSMRSAAGEAHLHGQGAAASTPLIHRRYSYDAAGLLGAIDDQLRGRTEYRYDETGRLVRANHGLPLDGVQAPRALPLLEQFAFDPAGNLLGNSAKPEDAHLKYLPRVNDNRLPSFWQKDADGTEQTVHYLYDARGQRIGKGVTKGERNGVWDTEYRWNVFGRLAGVKTRTLQAQYQYDPLGRRLGKTVHVNGTFRDAQEQQRADASRGYGTTLFGWDGDLMSLEVGEKNGLTHHIFEFGLFTPAIQIKKQTWNTRDSQAWYVQCDHLGTPHEIYGDEGQRLWIENSSAFGYMYSSELESPQACSESAPLQQNLKFQGQYFDCETRMSYNRHSYYDPQNGRYLSKDPIGLLGGSNKSVYPANPVSFGDALGLQATDGRAAMNETISGIGAAGTGVTTGGVKVEIGKVTAKVPGHKESGSLIDVEAGESCGAKEWGPWSATKKFFNKVFAKAGASVEGTVANVSVDPVCIDPGQVINRAAAEGASAVVNNNGLMYEAANPGASLRAREAAAGL